ncbi:hypothetical protein RhiirA1_542734, partial [Rhizophagus irregularis]
MSRRAIRRFIPPGPLPNPRRVRRDLTYLAYDIYEVPNIPAGHPHFGRNGAWCRRELRRELQGLGWRLNVQYSMISRFISVDRGLFQVRQLQTSPNLYWMPYGMQDNKDKRPCKKLKVNFTYKKPTDDELRNLIDSSRCKNTDYSTSNWIRALEKFRTDVNYQGLIEEVDTKEELEDQLCRFVHAMRKKDGSEYHVSSVNSCMFAINRHLNNKSVLSKPINIMDKDQYYKLWQILNGKVKSLVSQGRGERNGADGFTEDDLLQILDHPAMSGNDPA